MLSIIMGIGCACAIIYAGSIILGFVFGFLSFLFKLLAGLFRRA